MNYQYCFLIVLWCRRDHCNGRLIFFFFFLSFFIFFQGERPTRGREEEGYFHGYTSNNRGIHRAAWPFKPLHQHAYSPYRSLCISYGTDKENSSNDHELLEFAIISFILMTLMCDSGMIL